MNFADIRSRAEALAGFSMDRADEVHAEGFERLFDATSSDRHLAGFNLDNAMTAVVERVANYLVFLRDRESHPDMDAVEIRRPLFILDSGRTGSTLLQGLLALDPAARAPLRWELVSPSPPPRAETYEVDPRIAQADGLLRLMQIGAPDILKAHPMAARAPDECHWMMSHGTHNFVSYRYPGYWDWFSGLRRDQLLQLYEQYKRQVQHLQLFVRGEHWLSKSPVHRMYAGVIREVFPDAGIIRLHRDPRRCVPSLASLMAMVRAFSYEEVDKGEIARDVLTHFAEGTRRMIDAAAREQDGSSVDVAFDEFVAAPKATVQMVYQSLGYPYSDAFDAALDRKLAEASRPDGYVHRYTPEDFGLTSREITEACAPYLGWLAERGVSISR